MNEEGVIKFNCNWIQGDAIDAWLIRELNEWRNKLHAAKLIGVTPDGIGYGNMSVRLKGNQFIITGSQTGHLETLGPEHFALVTDYNVEQNSLTCIGPSKASSESLTHAMIYECCAEANAVFHVHDEMLWKNLLSEGFSTGASVAYGTPGMAKEVRRLFQSPKLHKIFAMGGHQDGVIAFGATPAEAGTLLLAKKLWDYHHLHHTMEKSDCIFVLGSHDTRVAERGAELYLQGWAPVLIFSGGLGNVTKGIWTETEADKFARIGIEKGVPERAIIIENRSTNTGENILFTQQLLKEKDLNPQSFIVVQKPYMERRSYATFKKHWPDKKLLVTSPQISFEDYPTEEISLERVINIMVGDLQRIKFYPAKGFQIPQDIPEDVWEAYEQLVALGFDKHLIT